MENNILKFKCPHCQQELAVRRPGQGTGLSLTCPRCGKAIRIKIQEREVRHPGQAGKPALGIASLALMGSTHTFALRRGDNTIGRADTDTLQDIPIGGDMTMSRRSVNLRVGVVTGGGYSYTLHVLNAKNPVTVNGRPIKEGGMMPLRVGDVLTLGETKLMLKV